MGVKEAYKRIKKAHEWFSVQSEDMCESCLTRMSAHERACAIATCIRALEVECPEVLEDNGGD